MVQTCQDDTSTELSGPGEPGLTMRMVEKGNTATQNPLYFVYMSKQTCFTCSKEQGKIW